jgi:hypothetical protein
MILLLTFIVRRKMPLGMGSFQILFFYRERESIEWRTAITPTTEHNSSAVRLPTI